MGKISQRFYLEIQQFDRRRFLKIFSGNLYRIIQNFTRNITRNDLCKKSLNLEKKSKIILKYQKHKYYIQNVEKNF